MSKSRAFLIMMAVAGIACSFCFKAGAEKGVFAPGDPQVLPAHDSRLADQAIRRQDELARPFNFTRVVTPDGPMQIELLVRPSDDETVISLWLETAHGMFAMDLLDPADQPVVSWRGQRGEQRLERKLVAGKYVVKVRAIDGARVHGVIGIKGPVIGGCAIDGGRLTEHPADPAHGYAWPYLLVTPAPLASGASRPLGAGTLLVAPNNTGFVTEDVELLRASAICELRGDESASALTLADSLGTPVLVPLFPRPELKVEPGELYLHALTRASLEEKDEPRFKRVDLQLIAMIDAARAELAAKGLPVQPRVLMTGFSASGMFTNRFTVLHPEQVLAAAVGSPGGWPIAPVAVDQGVTLSYPVGIADVEDLTEQAVDLATLRRVSILFLLGDDDNNDSVPFPDSFSATDRNLINGRFGKTLVARWGSAQRLYHTAGMEAAQFKLYPGVGHKVTCEMWKDIVDTFRTALDAH